MLLTTTERSVYKQLRDSCYPLITDYHADLTKHDRRAIQKNPGVPFLHWTRAMGTHIVVLYPAEHYPAKGVCVPFLFGQADRTHMLDSVVSLAEHCSKEDRTVVAHYYDGTKLRSVTADQAIKIARDYKQSVLAEWDRTPSRGTSNPFCGN